jgi:hypothetical protein
MPTQPRREGDQRTRTLGEQLPCRFDSLPLAFGRGRVRHGRHDEELYGGRHSSDMRLRLWLHNLGTDGGQRQGELHATIGWRGEGRRRRAGQSGSRKVESTMSFFVTTPLIIVEQIGDFYFVFRAGILSFCVKKCNELMIKTLQMRRIHIYIHWEEVQVCLKFIITIFNF